MGLSFLKCLLQCSHKGLTDYDAYNIISQEHQGKTDKLDGKLYLGKDLLVDESRESLWGDGDLELNGFVDV